MSEPGNAGGQGTGSDRTADRCAHWLEVEFVVAGEDVDAWDEALFAAGALSVRTEDADADGPLERALFGEPGEPEIAHAWRRTRIAALIEAAVSPLEFVARAAREAGLGTPDPVAITEVAERDWVAATQAQFQPIDIGARLRITPSWHRDAPQDRGAATPRVEIVLDPGLAFGTGTHPTTRMCLEWLDRELPAGVSVIDYGCGSGILAIAATRLGAGAVTAIDIDEQALRSTRDNAAANGVSLTVLSGERAACAPAQVVVANILASPLRMLAPLLEGLVAPGGTLILAGLLERQVDEVASAYREIELHAWAVRDGWACLVGKRTEPGSIG